MTRNPGLFLQLQSARKRHVDDVSKVNLLLFEVLFLIQCLKII